jgi:hypothetical protein
MPAPPFSQRTNNLGEGGWVRLPDVDTPEVSDNWGSSADKRYAAACDECEAATEHLARQHRRRALRPATGRPVLDPQYEAALDRLEGAERELRLAYEGRSALAQ